MSLTIDLTKKQQHYDKWRISLFKALKDKTIEIDPCSIHTWLKDAKVLKKTSASSSVVLLGKFFAGRKLPFSDNIVIKVSFASREGGGDNSFEVEICIYEKIISELLTRKITPNVMSYVYSFRCPNFYQQLHKDREPFMMEVLKQLTSIEKERDEDNVYDFNVAQFLILEKGSGGSMSDLLDDFELRSQKKESKHRRAKIPS